MCCVCVCVFGVRRGVGWANWAPKYNVDKLTEIHKTTLLTCVYVKCRYRRRLRLLDLHSWLRFNGGTWGVFHKALRARRPMFVTQRQSQPRKIHIPSVYSIEWEDGLVSNLTKPPHKSPPPLTQIRICITNSAHSLSPLVSPHTPALNDAFKGRGDCMLTKRQLPSTSLTAHNLCVHLATPLLALSSAWPTFRLGYT